MSPPNFVLELSDSAKADFRDILSYTWQMWGDRQIEVYRDVIDGALKAIAENPQTGRQRSGSGLLFSRAGRHLIFYRIDGPRIFVVRILHARMDLDSRLADEG
jgi:toxin ParE1/3/4